MRSLSRVTRGYVLDSSGPPRGPAFDDWGFGYLAMNSICVALGV